MGYNFLTGSDPDGNLPKSELECKRRITGIIVAKYATIILLKFPGLVSLTSAHHRLSMASADQQKNDVTGRISRVRT